MLSVISSKIHGFEQSMFQPRVCIIIRCPTGRNGLPAIVACRIAVLVHESCGLSGQETGDSLDTSWGHDHTEGMRSRVHPTCKAKYRVANRASYHRAIAHIETLGYTVAKWGGSAPYYDVLT